MADSPNSQIRRVVINVSTSGSKELKAISDAMGSMNQQIKKTTDVLGFFKKSFEAALGFSVFGVGITTLTGFSDEMQNLTNRVNVLTGDSVKTADVMEKLLGAANRTKTSIESLATIYLRLANSTKEVNLSSGALIALTETLQNTFRLSGATIQEATNTAIQFSQGLASGQLRGQELRSVLEQNAEFGNILTKSLGKTRGELYKLAEGGQLTAGVVLKALANSMDEVNKKSEKLTATFEQSLTVSLNKFKVAIGQINDSLGLSSGFAKAMDVVAEKFTLIATVLTVVLVPAIVKFLVPAIASASAALIAFALSNPFTAAIYALGAAVIFVFKNFDELKKFVLSAADAVEKFIIKIRLFFVERSGLLNPSEQYQKEKKDLIDSLNTRLTAIDTFAKEREKLDLAAEARKKAAEKAEQDRVKKELSGIKTGNGEIEKRSLLLEKLNKQYESGLITIGDYYEELERVDTLAAKRSFLTGKKDLEQYHTELRKNELSIYNRQLKDGLLTIDEFNKKIEESRIATLNEKFAAGKIGLKEFDEEMNKIEGHFSAGSAFRTGLEDYIKSVGTLGSGVAGVITRSFDKLEDALFEFTKTGKFNFNQFAQAILDDLNRIIIRSQIIAPLAKGLLNFLSPAAFSSGSAAEFGTYNQFGATATNQFASGGVVNGLTPFTYAKGGRLGVMGEAGPEAILPLQRGADGKLGVKSDGMGGGTVVNIYNQSGSEVQQTESTGPNGEKQIDILITAKVQEGIARGQFDKQFRSSFGLQRKGS